MKDFFKNKIVTTLIVVATVILAGVAIFTALRLYQLRSEPVAPTAPQTPRAVAPTDAPKACEGLSFKIQTSPSPTLTGTPSVTVTPTDEPRGGSSPTPTSTPGPTSTNTPAPTNTPTPGGASLPSAGISLPTILGMGVGLLVITLALLLAI